MYCETFAAFTVPGSDKLVIKKSMTPIITATKLVYLQIKNVDFRGKSGFFIGS